MYAFFNTATQKTYQLLLLCVLLLSFFYSIPVFAAEYVVTPLALNYDLQKRSIVQDTITIINNDSRRIRLYATVNTVATDGNGVVEGFQAPSDVDRTNTPTSWIEITRGRIEVDPGERKEVPFTIRMNPMTKPGDYNVFIGFAEAPNQPVAQQKVMRGDAPGTLLYISVDREQNMFLRLRRYTIDRFVTTEKGGVLSYTLENPGKTDVIPKGEVIIYDTKGNEITALPLNTEDTPVVAGKTTTYTLSVPNDLGLGKYKAFLSVEYGEYLTDSLNDTAYFYILPLKQIIITFVILLILATLFALYIHRRFDKTKDVDGAASVTMYLKEGESEAQHHDIDLKNTNNEK